jgi:hypothetical protein
MQCKRGGAASSASGQRGLLKVQPRLLWLLQVTKKHTEQLICGQVHKRLKACTCATCHACKNRNKRMLLLS